MKNIIIITGIHSALSAIVGSIFTSIRPIYIVNGFATESEFATIDIIYSITSLCSLGFLFILEENECVHQKTIIIIIIILSILLYIVFGVLVLYSVFDIRITYVMGGMVGLLNWAESFYLLRIYIDSGEVDRSFWNWTVFSVVGSIVGRYMFLPYIMIWSIQGVAYGLFSISFVYIIIVALYARVSLQLITNRITARESFRLGKLKYVTTISLMLLSVILSAADDSLSAWQAPFYIDVFSLSDTSALQVSLVTDIGTLIGVLVFGLLYERINGDLIMCLSTIISAVLFISIATTPYVLSIFLTVCVKILLAGIDNNIYLTVLKFSNDIGQQYIIMYYLCLQANFLLSSLPFVALFDTDFIDWFVFFCMLASYEVLAFLILITSRICSRNNPLFV